MGHNIPFQFSNNNDDDDDKDKRQTTNDKRQTTNDKRQQQQQQQQPRQQQQPAPRYISWSCLFVLSTLAYHSSLICCSHAGKALLMGFLANSSKEYMQQNSQAVLAASWILKTDVFCIDMLVEARPAVSDLPPAWQQNAIQYWYIFALTYGLFYPYFPVVFVYFLRILDEDIRYVSMVFFIIHVPAPGQPPVPGNKYRKNQIKNTSVQPKASP